ncbi:MAG: NAD(P)-dependent oxidoreductase [Streptosporangiaceae bacterium]
MICPVCQADNIEGADECDNCGADLRTVDLPAPETPLERRLVLERLADLGHRDPILLPAEAPVRQAIAAMQAAGVSRLITVSGSVVTDVGDDPFLRLVKPLVRRTQLRHVCADMRRAEEEVRRSGLDWTIMRPPRLTDKPAAGAYRTAIDRNLPREYTISRADLAVCILGLIGDRDTVRRHVAIAS